MSAPTVCSSTAPCALCGGTGLRDDGERRCVHCRGAGHVLTGEALPTTFVAAQLRLARSIPHLAVGQA